jgi:hypothetical protein
MSYGSPTRASRRASPDNITRAPIQLPILENSGWWSFRALCLVANFDRDSTAERGDCFQRPSISMARPWSENHKPIEYPVRMMIDNVVQDPRGEAKYSQRSIVQESQ